MNTNPINNFLSFNILTVFQLIIQLLMPENDFFLNAHKIFQMACFV